MNVNVANWVALNRTRIERMVYAIEQLRFAARRAADELSGKGDWGGLDQPLDQARNAVALAAGNLRGITAPPDTQMADALAGFLRGVENFNEPDTFNDWIAAWDVAMVYWTDFFNALCRATDQPIPSNEA